MNQNKKKYWLYVLQLEQGKYYIGVTGKTPEARMKQHISGFAGARWTRKYKPIKMHDKKFLGNITYIAAVKYENKVLREYIKKYGISKVRGGDITDDTDLIVIFGQVFEVEGLRNLLWFLGFAALMTVLVIIT